ncbi:MAG TPA: penicillin-binding protein 2, partial [Solirubrobacterales bacterium]
RRGNKLAASEDAATIYATPYQVENPPRAAERLAPILDQPKGEVLEALTAEGGFSYVAQKVDLGTAAKVEALDIEGIGQLPDTRRTYPQGEMAGQVIGAVGTENEGLMGLEEGEEDVLGGSDGERRIVNDALGEPIRLETVEEAEDGEDIQLTLDPVIQRETERALAGVGETYSPKGATAIVVDPRSSEVLAMANWPPVDPSNLEEASNEDLLNKATGFTYEPGSTFKAFTVAAALEEKTVTPTSEFVLPPVLQVADRTIEDSHPRGTETMSVATILAHSSNVGAATIGLGVGAEKFDKWIRRFGFGRPTGIQYPAEEQGLLLDLDEYSGSTLGNEAMGQGLSVTPIQMVAGYSAIANGGMLRQPRLVEKIGEEQVPEPKGKRVISEQTAAEIREMLEGVLGPGGTASGAEIPGYVLAGKTGTAEKADPITGGYSESKYVASFVGFAPAKQPKLLVAVMVDEPQGEIYGGLVAGPAFRDITSFALNYLKIAPE